MNLYTHISSMDYGLKRSANEINLIFGDWKACTMNIYVYYNYKIPTKLYSTI